MSAEQNKAIVQRYHDELFNKGNLAVADEVFDPNYLNSAFGKLGLPRGPEGFKQYVSMMRTAFPDLHCTIDDIFAVEDKVTTRFTFTGTFKGEMMGITPTGKKFAIMGIIIVRWVDGKEVEAWESMDTLAFYQQLGITPPAQ